MAGRGTDILLGGNSTFLASALVKEILEVDTNLENSSFVSDLSLEDPELINDLKKNYKELLKKPLSELEKQSDPVTVLFLQIYNSIISEQKLLVNKTY